VVHPGLTATDDDLAFFLNNSNGIILIVTRNFLENESFSSTKEIHYLISQHIPFLPLFFENNLEDKFNEKYHALHGISPLSKDQSALPFAQKLLTFLTNTIGTEQENEEIASVFRSHIFLSYRKKDRTYANNLIKQLHGNHRLYDTAIWYDEFLDPGENFNVSILQQITRSNLVIFLITKNFLEKGNYIERVEFVETKKSWKAIFGCRM
jgi:hypothetical protein